MTDPFTALAEPARRRILDVLRTGPIGVTELSVRLDIPQPNVSKHLKVLRDSGLVTRTVDAQRRVHALDPQGFAAVDLWFEPYRALWATHLDALEEHLDAQRRRVDQPRNGERDPS